MEPKTHTMKISTSLWKLLNAKKNPGDTFEDVIWRFIKAPELRRKKEESEDVSK